MSTSELCTFWLFKKCTFLYIHELKIHVLFSFRSSLLVLTMTVIDQVTCNTDSKIAIQSLPTLTVYLNFT